MDAKTTHGLPITYFREISTWLQSSILKQDELLELIINSATRMMAAKASSLLLMDEKSKKLFFKVATGEKGSEVRQFQINIGEGIVGYVAQTGEPLLIPDVSLDPRWDKRISEHTGFKTRSIACVPMKVDDRVIGVVELIDKEDGTSFTQEDIKMLLSIADLASRAIHNAREIDHFKQENKDLKEELFSKYKIVGDSRSIKTVIFDALKVANSKTTTLILGESGTGKELLARLIHQSGHRKTMPLVVLNCAALPETLLEDELFGHEKGSFTGAIGKKVGKFELADDGTIFLDEIAEMSPGMQAKLLRVLQEGVFYRIGGTEPISVDVRIIAATNRDLPKEIAKEKFREDLFYRLNVVQLQMPPLRDRKDDIPLLAKYFLDMFKIETGLPNLTISKDAMDKMIKYNWPGNVRELRNAIERAVVMGNRHEIMPEDLPIGAHDMEQPGLEFGLTLKDALDKFKKEFVKINLDHTGGNRSKAAKIMDIQRTYLSRLISQYNL
jgi:Nif-specific regulatory protein